MADITMCTDKDCPSRKSCYRHPDSGTYVNPKWQSWGYFERKPQEERCDDYIKM